jgi:hypothetical protein
MRTVKQDGARCFLWSQGVALKDFTAYAKATTERIANNARKLVADVGRPVVSFDHVKSHNPAPNTRTSWPRASPRRMGSARGSSV